MNTVTPHPVPPRALFTRRGLFRSAAAAGLLSFSRPGRAAPRFWDVKPPAQWTPDEIAQLLSNSPWAKPVTAQYRTALEGLEPSREGQPKLGRGEATAGECGLVPCGSIMPGKVVVIWESAQPVRDALRVALPPAFNNRYVLSVRGFEIDLNAERLTQGSELSAKGKPPVLAGIVTRRNNTWLFGFSRDLLPLGPADKDVLFTVRTGPDFNETLVRASFSPREMTCRGALAL